MAFVFDAREISVSMQFTEIDVFLHTAFQRLAFEVSYGAPSATPTMVSHEGTAETVVPEPIDATVNTVATTDTAVTTNTMAPQLKRPTQTMMGTTTQVKISVEGVKDSGKAMTNTANL